MNNKLNHKSVSFVKSLLRIVAGSILVYAGVKWQAGYLAWAGGLLIGAEVLGIIEEIV